MRMRKKIQLAEQLALALDEGRSPVEVLEAQGHSKAAHALEGGASLAEVLITPGLLPQIYRGAFSSSQALRALSEASADWLRARERSLLLLYGVLWSLLPVLVALAFGGRFALPQLQIWLEAHGTTMNEIWMQGFGLYSTLGSGLGFLLALLLLLLLAVLGPALWFRLPTGRLNLRISVCQQLAILLKLGRSLEEALEQISLSLPRGALRARLRRGAQQLKGGEEAAVALRRLGLIPSSLERFWSVRGAHLPQITETLAQAMRADLPLLQGREERWFWSSYAFLAGGLALGFGLLLVSAWVEALTCFV